MSWRVCVCACLLVAAAAGGQQEEVSYQHFKLLRVAAEGREEVQRVRALAAALEGTHVWAAHPRSALVDLLSAPHALPRLRDALNAAGLNYTVVVNDLQELINNENPALQPEDEEWENRSGHRLTWKRYHRNKDIDSYMDYLANLYPEICQLESIGRSSEGRELRVLKVSTDSSKKKPAVWIDGGIHAREWISPATVTYLLLQLVEFRADHPSLIEEFDWFVLPVVNPDGYEYSHTNDRLWRKTRSTHARTDCVGVDANRNFDSHWMEVGSSSNACVDIYAGPRPFSEPETKAMSDFIMSHRDQIKVYLTMHSYSQMWLVPWGYKAEKPSDYYDMFILAEQAVNALKKIRNTDYLLGTADELVYTSSGGSDDWAKEKAGIKYAYTVELPDDGHYGFVLPASQIEPIGKEIWEGVKSMMLYYADNLLH